MKNKFFIFLIIFNFIVFMNTINYAGSISATAEILIENIIPGKIYSLKDLGNYTLRITNNTDKEIEIKIEPIYPDKTLLRRDFEIIPSTSWVETDRDRIILAPNQVGLVDVFIGIPKSEKNLNKKYQVHIKFQTVPKEGTGVIMVYGLESILLINTAKGE